MIYVFDTNSFIVLGHYFPEHFPSFWARFDHLVRDGAILSVREVQQELDHQATRPHLLNWVDQNKQIFLPPGPEETFFVSRIFAVPHFQQLVKQDQILKGTPVADPFVIACAKARDACVVTEETLKVNSARIPNVCARFGVDCTDLQGMMKREGWQF